MEPENAGTNAAARLCHARAAFGGGTMKTFAIALLAGVGALSIGGAAKASDVITTSEFTNPDPVQKVRLIYRTRGGSRVIVRDSYNYMPRERYYERRTYRDWDDGPRVGIRAPGVSVGIGVDRY
jgi:hypothetical protein